MLNSHIPKLIWTSASFRKKRGSITQHPWEIPLLYTSTLKATSKSTQVTVPQGRSSASSEGKLTPSPGNSDARSISFLHLEQKLASEGGTFQDHVPLSSYFSPGIGGISFRRYIVGVEKGQDQGCHSLKGRPGEKETRLDTRRE